MQQLKGIRDPQIDQINGRPGPSYMDLSRAHLPLSSG